MNCNLLRRERKLRGWSQAKVASVLGVSTKTVMRWERGRTVPHPHYRWLLAALFGKTMRQLGFLEDRDERPVQADYSGSPKSWPPDAKNPTIKARGQPF